MSNSDRTRLPGAAEVPGPPPPRHGERLPGDQPKPAVGDPAASRRVAAIDESASTASPLAKGARHDGARIR
jgi:hypothetical protein